MTRSELEDVTREASRQIVKRILDGLVFLPGGEDFWYGMDIAAQEDMADKWREIAREEIKHAIQHS